MLYGMTTRAVPTTSIAATGYLRVSTAEQGDSGLGLAAQEAAIRDECERRGWTLNGLYVDVASGKSTAGRPQLAAALEALDRGEADVLVVLRLDRLARSTSDLLAVLDRAEGNSWALASTDLALDMTTPSGRFTATVMGAAATLERDLIAARTRDALAARKAQGARLGRPVALPQGVRDRIARDRDAGLSLRAIAQRLNEQGIPTAQGGARWHPSTVRNVLASLALDAEAQAARQAAA